MQWRPYLLQLLSPLYKIRKAILINSCNMMLLTIFKPPRPQLKLSCTHCWACVMLMVNYQMFFQAYSQHWTGREGWPSLFCQCTLILAGMLACIIHCIQHCSLDILADAHDIAMKPTSCSFLFFHTVCTVWMIVKGLCMHIHITVMVKLYVKQ